MIVMANRVMIVMASQSRRLCFENLTYENFEDKSCLQVYVFRRIIIFVVEYVSDFITVKYMILKY